MTGLFGSPFFDLLLYFALKGIVSLTIILLALLRLCATISD